MKEELWEILRDLEMGKISVNYANDRILRLFGVVGRSELLKAFADKWNIDNDIADSPIIHDGFIDEFIKSL